MPQCPSFSIARRNEHADSADAENSEMRFGPPAHGPQRGIRYMDSTPLRRGPEAAECPSRVAVKQIPNPFPRTPRPHHTQQNMSVRAETACKRVQGLMGVLDTVQSAKIRERAIKPCYWQIIQFIPAHAFAANLIFQPMLPDLG